MRSKWGANPSHLCDGGIGSSCQGDRDTQGGLVPSGDVGDTARNSGGAGTSGGAAINGCGDTTSTERFVLSPLSPGQGSPQTRHCPKICPKPDTVTHGSQLETAKGEPGTRSILLPVPVLVSPAANVCFRNAGDMKYEDRNCQRLLIWVLPISLFQLLIFHKDESPLPALSDRHYLGVLLALRVEIYVLLSVRAH